MGKIEKISVSLTEELLADVQSAIDSGDYASTSEVVREALREWRDQRTRKEAALAELKQLIAEAQASGYEDGPIDFDTIKAEGRKRLGPTRG
jgi:antitoxin ParD1/3/4